MRSKNTRVRSHNIPGLYVTVLRTLQGSYQTNKLYQLKEYTAI